MVNKKGLLTNEFIKENLISLTANTLHLNYQIIRAKKTY